MPSPSPYKVLLIWICVAENIILHRVACTRMSRAGQRISITTSAGRLVDLGTDFGISALAENLVEAAVFSGQVEVFAGKDQFILNANEGVRLQPGKALRTLSKAISFTA